MGKEHQKRVLAALMAASIAIPTPVLAASPADFSDFPNNWATNALSYAVSNGLLSGDSGKIRANDTLKRAEMAAILNRLAGAVKGASLTGYTDVPATAWYYDDMAKAVQMGTFAGYGGMLRPEAPITSSMQTTARLRLGPKVLWQPWFRLDISMAMKGSSAPLRPLLERNFHRFFTSWQETSLKMEKRQMPIWKAISLCVKATPL